MFVGLKLGERIRVGLKDPLRDGFNHSFGWGAKDTGCAMVIAINIRNTRSMPMAWRDLYE